MALEARFVQTARQAGATAPRETLEAVAAELVARWSEPHRSYHNLAHLEAVLDEVETEPVVALAAWGHDAVYNSRAAGNEERSAQLLQVLLQRCGVAVEAIRQAARLVRLTAGHAAEPADRLGHVLADADLAVLAGPELAYASYVEAVRAEYAHVPEELWRVGRSAVLQSLLDLPRLYWLHPERESVARANITRELRELERI